MGHYTNLDGTTPDQGLGAVLKWQLGKKRGKQPPFDTPRRDNDGSALREPGAHLTWIGHATFVQRLGGLLLATDPIWSPRIHTVKRLAAPGVAFENVPPLDVVTVSHAHFDHLDLPSLKAIGNGAVYVVPKDNGELLKKAGLDRVVELDWWETHTIGDLRITLVPAQHWSMRTPFDKNERLWGGYVYEAPEGVSYHAGDTAYSADVFGAIANRCPPIDWAMLPIGAYEPRWFMKKQHMGPEEAARAFQMLRAKYLVAMHWGTFKLTDEPLGDPPRRLRAWCKEHGYDESRVWILDVGETRRLVDL